MNRRDFLKYMTTMRLMTVPELGFSKLPSKFGKSPPFGNLTLMHFTDCHAQLLPVYYREPSSNLGLGDRFGRPPHLVGQEFLKFFGINANTFDAHAFTHLNFSEVAGVYGKMGGFAHLATLIKNIRRERGEENTLLLDGGDTWQGSATALWSKGADMLGASNLLGVDVMTGHWEFTYGSQQVKENIAGFSGDFVAQNVSFSDEAFFTYEAESRQIFKPYVVKELKNARVAIIGQAFPYTPIANPKRLIPDWQFGIQEQELQQLVDEILDYARLETGQSPLHKQHLDLTELIANVQEKLTPLPGATISLQLPDRAMLYGDGHYLERALQKRFPGEKRFGLEGAEAFLVLCAALLQRAAAGGVERVVIGGMHPGRLNLLVHLLGKPLAELYGEVGGRPPFPAAWGLAADVVYHNGYEGRRRFAGRELEISLLPHPSHLSVVAAVGLGRARAEQQLLGPDGRRRVLPLPMHTDAAFAGQGVVSEMLQLSRLPPFDLGGAVHLVLDNHIGFTTGPEEGRSAAHATDAALAAGIPVLQVNGDDVDAVWRVARVAADYRQRFGEDLVVALHGYRRRGHNELDDPRYTQPLAYGRIERHPTVVSLYRDRLAAEGLALAEPETRVRRYREAWEANRLICKGVIQPTLSKVFPLEQSGEAALSVHRNEHEGKIGILCLADREGLGVLDTELREKLGDRISMYRD